ncbi:MAG: alkyl/aryl-sulfatase, partial [Nocardia sp.]|nr:alkyl/aryl-sulfatase [Nocardia sp.]
GTWRNFYLTGAQELRKGPSPTPIQSASPEMMTALTLDMIIDSLAVRVDGLRAASVDFTMDWELTDENLRHRITLSNGALTHRAPTPEAPATGSADLTLTLTKEQLLTAVSGKGFDGVTITGDKSLLETFIGLLDAPDPQFPIVTP